MGLSSKQNSKLNAVNNITSVILSPFQQFIDFTGGKFSGTFIYFSDITVLKEENEALKKEIDILKEQNEELTEYRIKINELKKDLNIKDQFDEEFELLGANIMAKDMGNWFNVFTIDRGLQDGVTNNMAIITRKGLVGRVLSAGLTSSKVVAIIDEDSTVSARITKTMDLVTAKGDFKLKDQGLLRLNYVSPEIDISVNDSVETSGLGGYYPRGIKIGEIKEVRRKNGEFDRYAIIEPAVDFKRLEEVYVLKDKNTKKAGEEEK
jgi:rod shape-determining protein MreC